MKRGQIMEGAVKKSRKTLLDTERAAEMARIPHWKKPNGLLERRGENFAS
jgi:hypothetical protein